MAERQTLWPQKPLPFGACGFESHPGYLDGARGPAAVNERDPARAPRVDPFAEAEALVDGFGARPAGSDAERRAAAHTAASAGLSAVQFVPSVALVVAVLLLVDLALWEPRAGENDNASGLALALRLAETLRPQRFAVHVLLTGAQKSGSQGMRAFLARHGGELSRDRTVVLNLDTVGSGEPRFRRSERPLIRLRAHGSVGGPAAEITPPATSRGASDAYAARSVGLAAITLTCHDPRERLEEHALERAEAAALELIERLDDLSAR